MIDDRPLFGYKRKSRSSRDAFARALSEAERVRRLRAGLQPAPGRTRAINGAAFLLMDAD